MGRRSTSSTKSGKFMNPTDQASKYRVEQPRAGSCTTFWIAHEEFAIYRCQNDNYFSAFLTGKEARKRELKKVLMVFKHKIHLDLPFDLKYNNDVIALVIFFASFVNFPARTRSRE